MGASLANSGDRASADSGIRHAGALDLDSWLDHVTSRPDADRLAGLCQLQFDLRGQLGRVEELIADSGYFSQANVEACETAGMTPFIAVSREEHNQRLEDRLSKPEPVARDADSVTRMKHRLKTKAGKEVYGQRKCTVEPVFGIIKSVLGYNQFLRRGLENVKAEWKLVSLAWNLKRMHVLSKPSRKNPVMAGLDQSIGAF